LLSSADRFRRAAATFEPLPVSLDGCEAPDLITGVWWGTAASAAGEGDSGGSTHAADCKGDAGGDAGERLLVVCQSSCLYILDRCAGAACWQGPKLAAAAG
jgi:hypothetical protein